jgi:hypothetical protein
MKKSILLSFFIVSLFLSAGVNAQDYKSAIGGKLGYGLVASYKTFMSENNAIELFGGLRWGGLVAGAFYQKHKDIDNVENLRWFLGGGATATTWTFGTLDAGYIELAAHFDIGLEYTFTDMPLNVSVDYAPGIVLYDTWDFTGSYNRFRGGYGSLTVRYVLGSGSSSGKK